MEYTADNVESQIKLLMYLLKLFAVFNMRLWYDNENLEENMVDNIGIMCSHCEETTGLSVKNTNY